MALTYVPDSTGAAADGNQPTVDIVGQYADSTQTNKYLLDRYIPEMVIPIIVNGLRPNTRVSVFCEKTNVTHFCAPANYDKSILSPKVTDFYAQGAAGTAIFTDAFGSVVHLFYVPAKTFRLTTQDLTIVDWTNAQDDYDTKMSNKTMVARTKVNAFNHDSTDYTDPAVISTTPSRNTSNGTTTTAGSGTATFADPNNPRFDPMCQSFYIGSDLTQGADGMYLKSVDLYFSAKSNTQPVTIDIRTMENGIPTTKVIPNSVVTLPSSNVTTSNTAASATTFVFETPIYVRAGYEYAMSVIPGGGSPDYSVWTAKVGTADIANGSTVPIWGQGILFTSATGTTWTPIQNESLKFTVNRADFANYASGANTVLVNDDLEFISYADMSTIPFKVGEYVYQQPSPLPGFVSVTSTNAVVTYNTTASGSLFANLYNEFAVNDHILVVGSLPTSSDTYRRFNHNIFANAVTLKVSSIEQTNNNIVFSYANGSPANTTTGTPWTNTACYFFKPYKGHVQIQSGNPVVVGTGTRFDQDVNTLTGDDDVRRPVIIRHGNSTVVGHHVLHPNNVSNSTYMTVRNPPTLSNTQAFPIGAPTARVVSVDFDRQIITLDRSTANAQSSTTAWINAYASPSYFAPGRVLIGSESNATAIIRSINDIVIHSAQPNFYQTTVQGTDITYSINATAKAVDGNGNITYANTTFPSLPISQTTYFNTDVVVSSKSNEIINNGGAKSLRVYANMSSTSSLLSPAVDRNHISLIAKRNIISDFAAGETTNQGTALAKTVSKIVTLSDGNDAEDLNVYLTAYKPAGTDIQVYAKILNANDPETFTNKAWSPLLQVTDPNLFSDITNQQDYKEFQYTFPPNPVTIDMADDLVTTNNTTVIKSTNGNTVWQSVFTNNQLIAVYSDVYKTNFEVKAIASVDSNTQITFSTNVTLSNTSSAFISSLVYPNAGYKNSGNNNVVRYYSNDGVPHDTYKQYAIKIVMLSNTGYVVPKINDMRTIALSV